MERSGDRVRNKVLEGLTVSEVLDDERQISVDSPEQRLAIVQPAVETQMQHLIATSATCEIAGTYQDLW